MLCCRSNTERALALPPGMVKSVGYETPRNGLFVSRASASGPGPERVRHRHNVPFEIFSSAGIVPRHLDPRAAPLRQFLAWLPGPDWRALFCFVRERHQTASHLLIATASVEHLDNTAVGRINRQPNIMSRFPGPAMQVCGTDGMAWQGEGFPSKMAIGVMGRRDLSLPLPTSFSRVFSLSGFAIEIVLNGCCVFESGGGHSVPIGLQGSMPSRMINSTLYSNQQAQR